MRVYLVKSEAEFQALAYKKYTHDLEHRNSQSGFQEKNYSGGRTKEATNSDGKGRGGGRGSRGSKGSGGNNRGKGSTVWMTLVQGVPKVNNTTKMHQLTQKSFNRSKVRCKNQQSCKNLALCLT